MQHNSVFHVFVFQIKWIFTSIYFFHCAGNDKTKSNKLRNIFIAERKYIFYGWPLILIFKMKSMVGSKFPQILSSKSYFAYESFSMDQVIIFGIIFTIFVWRFENVKAKEIGQKHLLWAYLLTYAAQESITQLQFGTMNSFFAFLMRMRTKNYNQLKHKRK